METEAKLQQKSKSALESLQTCLNKLEEVLTCSICLDIFRDPRILKCRHTFCLSCLHNLYRTSYSKFIKCPNCKQETPIEVSGVEGLEKNKELDIISKVQTQMKQILDSQGEELNKSISNQKSLPSEKKEENFNVHCVGVPFRINQKQALQKFNAWLPQQQHLALGLPQGLEDLEATPFFVPCYEFKITANTKYSCKLILAHSNGVSVNLNGDHGGQYTVLIYASERLNPIFRNVLETSKIDVIIDEDLTKIIEDQKIEIMYKNIDQESAQSNAEGRIQTLEREECKTFVLTRNAHVGAYAVSDLLSTSVCERTLFSERLLPVYLGSYRYKNRKYQYIVSGITGDIFGEYPTSKVVAFAKSAESFAKFIAMIVLMLAFVWFLQQKQQERHSYSYH